MAIIKCKMCGGDLEVTPGTAVAECEYCGTKQTLPKVNDEVIQNLFNRANNLRIKCEFDKAEQIYEKILQENDAESEAHWGIVLCKYGIEYVEDPKTYKRIPTCHRTSYDAVTTDADYLAAVEHADTTQRGIYEAEAKAIDEIQKNILNIVKNEKPFDVFICYKETDEDGKRTIDSTIANDIYYQLTQEGLKVFYAAITLEDKLGQEYEPYIFAALNSAKVMLVIGTKLQYFSAVWVKNEWSRFMKLMKSDRNKLLIPCYKDMDAYDLPEEFAHLQAQDMSKIGFINDVVRGIKKVIVKDEPKATVVKETVVTSGNANTAALLKRVFIFLEDGNWTCADEYCEKVLDVDPECAQAYLGKLMAELGVRRQDDLKNCAQPFDENGNYQKAVRFADEDLKCSLIVSLAYIKDRNENARLEEIYNRARNMLASASAENQYKEVARLLESIQQYKDAQQLAKECRDTAEQVRIDAEQARVVGIYNDAHNAMRNASTEFGFKQAAAQFGNIKDYKDAAQLMEQCYDKAEIVRKDKSLDSAKNKMARNTIEGYQQALDLLTQIRGWKNADQLLASCQDKIAQLKAEEEAIRQERIRIAELEQKRHKIRKITTSIVATVAAIGLVIFFVVLFTKIIPAKRYDEAMRLDESGEYGEEHKIVDSLGDFNDSGVMTHAQYLATEADAAVEVECYVQATQSWWDDKIVVYAMDKSYGGYFAYNLTCSEEDAAKLVPGTKINIKGYKTYYKGMPEIAEGATFTIVEGADTFIASAEILTEKLGKQELVNHAGQFAAFQGLTVKSITFKNDEPGNDIYVDFTLGDATYSFCVERYLTGPETDVYKAFLDGDVKVGDVVDVYGFVYWCDADEDASGDGISTHITKITKG